MRVLKRRKAVFGLCGGLVIAGVIGSFIDTNKTKPSSETAEVLQSGPDVLAAWMDKAGDRDLSQGIALAKERGAMMRELIRSDPERAIRESLTLSEWAALPEEIKPYVEEPFSVQATVEVLISCGEGISETTITTESPTLGTLETYVYGRRNGVGSKNGAPVQGIRLGGMVALRAEVFQTLGKADETAALSIYPVAVANPGGDSVAALAGGRVFYFKNAATLNEANARLAALEELPGPNAGAQTLFEFLEEATGDIDFQALEELAYEAAEEWTGTPRDMYVILVDFPDRTGQPTDPVALSNSVNTTVSQQIWDMSYEKTHIVCTVNMNTYRMPSGNAAYTNNTLLYTHATNAVAGVDLSSYETVCVFHPAIDGESYAGLASVGGKKMWLKSASSRVITHELGHNYGSSHAAAWAVQGSNPVDPAGTASEYGEFSDIMGSGEIPAGHFNAWNKKKITWLDAENWTSVASSGTYRIYRSDHRETTELVRGLEIDKGDGGDYWLGLRQEYPAYDTYGRGAYLLWEKPSDNRSYLLDTTPQSADGKYDGGLALGQTYSDSVAAVHITPTARGGQTPNEWMDITVNLGSFPSNAAPTATLSGPTNLTVQASALFTVTASDSDGDELAYFWVTGDGLVKPNAPTLSTAWLSGSTATVSCVVSDMKGGTNKVSQTVVLSSPLENWTQRSSGTTKNLKDIALGNGRLVAVGGNGGTTTYSDDGTNWTVHTDGDNWLGNVYLEGVVYDGSQFIAVGMDYDSGWEHLILTSPAGTSWTERYDSNSGSGPNIRLNDVAYGGGYYVAVGDNGTIVRSTDGISWSAVASGTSTDLKGVAYGDGTFVVVGDEGGTTAHVVLTSADGLSWDDHSSGSGITDNQWMFDVEYLNDRFLAGGGFRSGIQYSTDQGETFQVGLDDDYEMDGFAYGDGIYLATGVFTFTGRTNDINLISVDGANWSEIATELKDNQNAAIFFNGTFISVGDNGSIWQSDAAGASAAGFASWQLENGIALGFNRDPLDDADFDGHLNLEEYAMGSSATDAGSTPADSAVVDLGTYFQVAYERDGIRPDIDYTVERTTHLGTNDWSTANTVMVENSATNLAVRSAFSISSQTNEFMRLKIELK